MFQSFPGDLGVPLRHPAASSHRHSASIDPYGLLAKQQQQQALLAASAAYSRVHPFTTLPRTTPAAAASAAFPLGPYGIPAPAAITADQKYPEMPAFHSLPPPAASLASPSQQMMPAAMDAAANSYYASLMQQQMNSVGVPLYEPVGQTTQV